MSAANLVYSCAPLSLQKKDKGTRPLPLQEITMTLMSIKLTSPTLLLQWCYVLQIVSFNDHEWWQSLFCSSSNSGSVQVKPEQMSFSSDRVTWNWASCLTKDGALLLYCTLLSQYLKVGYDTVTGKCFYM